MFQKLTKQQTRLFSHIGILALVGCLFVLLVMTVKPFNYINLWLSDQLFVPKDSPSNIVVAGIDDATLKTYGKWSEWRRNLHAQAIDNLVKAGARVIAYDVLFADVSADDSALAEAVRKAGNVVLGKVGVEPLPRRESEYVYTQFLTPVPSLTQSALALGHANFTSDNDGVARRVPLVVKDAQGQSSPALSVSILHALFSRPLPGTYPYQNSWMRMLDRNIPVDDTVSMRVDFNTERQNYTYLSYGDIIAGNFDAAIVKHKIVLIGMTATGELDAWLTPISPSKLPGVWLHAFAMDTILKQKFLVEADASANLAILLFLVLLTSIPLPRLRLKWGGILTGGLFVLYLATAFWAFDRGYVLNILYPLALLPIAFGASVIFTVIAEQSEKRFIGQLFGRYVSPEVASEIMHLADECKLELGGQRREVTVMFADLRGYTQMSERLAPELVVERLNIYLSAIINSVLANEGMVNKFAGDNIMAVWNAPQNQAEHARLAVKAAWEAQQSVDKLQTGAMAADKVQFGIGVNSGEVIAGNVGSSGRCEYTVIGDPVNLAARICAVTPGGEVWVGPDTYRQVEGQISASPLPSQTFKGKSEAVVVYKVTGLK